jgi:signal peptidase I
MYQVKDNEGEVAKDNKWFTEYIIVKGDTITINVDGKPVTQWTQPADWSGTKEFPGRRISPGTIALQGHDPGSTVYYKNILIKPLN